MKVEYEPSGLSDVKNLNLDPIQFSEAVQIWVDQNQENINPNGGTANINFNGRNNLVTYNVNNGLSLIHI